MMGIKDNSNRTVPVSIDRPCDTAENHSSGLSAEELPLSGCSLCMTVRNCIMVS